jgi:hypothetical protein
VTDVAEERGLGTIQLGELLGTATLIFQRAHAGERTRDVRAHQPHEVAIVVIELAPRTQPANEIAVGFVGASRELENCRVLHRFRPRAARELHIRRWPCQHELRVATERPRLVAIGRVDAHRRAVVAGGNSRDGFEARGARRRIPAIESGERNVLAVVLEHCGGIAKDVASRRCTVADPAEVAQCCEPALADDAPGRLADDAEDAADLAGFVAHRVVRNVEVGFLDVAVALDDEQQVRCPERIARVHDAGQQWLQHVPQLTPAFPAGQAQHPRVLAAEHRSVRVVVNGDEIGPPEEHDLGPRRQQVADAATQALRPVVDGTERRRRPILGPDQSAQLAAADEPVRCHGPFCTCGLHENSAG